MARAVEKPRLATVADLLILPEDERNHEIIVGELLPREAASGRHGDAQSAVAARLKPRFQRRQPSGRSPGGWWILTEVEVELETHEVYRPDVVGWRREHLSEPPTDPPIRVRPDWVCEVLSPSNQGHDRVTKHDTYERCGVPHYWIVDPKKETLTVYRLTPQGYLMVLLAKRGEVVRAEPFDAVETPVGVLFGDDDLDEE